MNKDAVRPRIDCGVTIFFLLSVDCCTTFLVIQPGDEMNKVYQAARAAYKAQEFANFSIVPDDIDQSVIVYRNGKFIAVYVSRLVAELDIARQTAKASKFIQ